MGGTLHERMSPVGPQRDSSDGEVWQPQPLLVIILVQHLPSLPNRLERHYAGALLHCIKRLQNIRITFSISAFVARTGTYLGDSGLVTPKTSACRTSWHLEVCFLAAGEGHPTLNKEAGM